MQSINECFVKVKKDYLKFLNKEKIYKKSMTTHIRNLKKIYIPIAFWIENKHRIKQKTIFMTLIKMLHEYGTKDTFFDDVLKQIQSITDRK